MNRRTFLKAAGMGSMAFAAGCTQRPEKKLFALVQAPEDMVTGKAAWYAGTCRECPAGCGVIAKNREGRLIKLEGNPLHPINRGNLCMRGQSALQAVYDPDRITTPLVKERGRWLPMDFKTATTLLKEKTRTAASRGPNRIRMVTEMTGETLFSLFTTCFGQWHCEKPVVYEPFAYETLKFAHQEIFGQAVLPSFHMERADLILGLGADFLETWLSPVEYAGKFKAMHAIKNGRKGCFIHVAPYMSLTGANADRFIPCRPGGEAVAALALVKKLLAADRGKELPPSFRRRLAHMVEGFTEEKVKEKTGMKNADLKRLAERLLASEAPLVLGSPAAAWGSPAALTDMAATFINLLLDPGLSLYDFEQRHRVEQADSRKSVLEFFQQLEREPVDLLFFHNTNPLFTLPPDSPVERLLQKEELFTVCFTNVIDETALKADLIFPVQLALETWDAYESKQALVTTQQPAMGSITKAPSMGDLFLGLAFDNPPVQNYKQYLMKRLLQQQPSATPLSWVKMVQKGGRFDPAAPQRPPKIRLNPKALDTLDRYIKKSPSAKENQSCFMAVPSIRFFDGRGANKPWLCEIPDPVTQVAWQTPLMIHPAFMEEKGWKTGDLITLKSDTGEMTAPAYPYEGLHKNLMAMHMGQGHTVSGRYAKNQGLNPLVLLENRVAQDSGCPSYSTLITAAEKTGRKMELAHTDGSRSQHHRKIALTVNLERSAVPHPQSAEGLGMNDFPLALPVPEGYSPHRDIYPPHDHDDYRWGMAVDLDRCIGCGACVAACYAENNVAVVGEKQMIKGREMAWLRIERYQEEPNRLIFFPMLCQHCDNAPCESVCPVYAPHHSREGLNNQIYNRCIGTRFCAQNCPYKVRRFNWFDWKWPEPLPLQLNPNVTVRSKGVMEKCSFCVQRIKAAHNRAKNRNRKIRDGEVVPACVQTCPTGALVFGNFMDKESRLSQLVRDPRAYQAMGYLNTKPAVIYLKKIASGGPAGGQTFEKFDKQVRQEQGAQYPTM